jgi:GAF domain-containing protein
MVSSLRARWDIMSVWRGGGGAAAGAEAVTAGGLGERNAVDQGAPRQVATLVARAASQEKVFAAVAAEVGRLLEVDFTHLSRYDPDGAATTVGTWNRTDGAGLVPGQTRWSLGGRNATTLVFQTGRPARIDDYGHASGAGADVGRELGIRSAVGIPIKIEGRLWGVMTVGSTREHPLPVDTEERLAGFTELVATGIANAQARVELRGFAEEQAALRRVATLVARAAPPEEVFAAVTTEVRRLLAVDLTVLCRYDPDGVLTYVGWSQSGNEGPVGVRVPLGGRNVAGLVFETGRPARVDDYGGASGAAADVVRPFGLRAAVGVPVGVEGRLWGVMTVAFTREHPLPVDTEERLAGFTELVATAIANAQARVELRGFAEEQAALRRVATLVASGTPPEQVFDAVTAEVGRLLHLGFTVLNRYDPDGTAVTVGAWTSTCEAVPFPVGTCWSLGGRNVTTLVFETGRPARIDAYPQATGPAADLARERGARSLVGAPVSVAGRLWGFMSAVSTSDEPLPADTEARLAGFTELVATALANTEAHVALTASRARIVATADTIRRHIERDLHDGAQQRLVSLALHLRSELRAAVPPEAAELTAQLDGVAAELGGVLDELREIAHGLHPAALATGGCPGGGG